MNSSRNKLNNKINWQKKAIQTATLFPLTAFSILYYGLNFLKEKKLRSFILWSQFSKKKKTKIESHSKVQEVVTVFSWWFSIFPWAWKAYLCS